MTALSMYQASVPVFCRGLAALAKELEKAAAYAAERKFEPGILVNARLAPDMLSLAGQVQRASDTSKFSGERLSGTPSPKFPDTETTFPELQERIANTISYLQGLDPAAFAGSEDKEISLSTLGSFKGDAYLLNFAVPNFFFHLATAHAILRENGVAVGKRDFLDLQA
ncbi:hypothetical protein GCM10007301_03260 [Azorhizobium oxalatiphilum]|uniref:DUF1993 domain-containing protein n=1 Tax=Azorhizobium oxalatiphilum TaxID=980631 RepID=A0A917F504_9HYPH|nr:DUF1993 domain-containing protein [Azorhizobium oxalatiphilum]GGF47233.1 hypothetical protein GCM10007301_03260 [Azorhizobium oxalatiphilum]